MVSFDSYLYYSTEKQNKNHCSVNEAAAGITIQGICRHITPVCIAAEYSFFSYNLHFPEFMVRCLYYSQTGIMIKFWKDCE